jgi:hypothetical protein
MIHNCFFCKIPLPKESEARYGAGYSCPHCPNHIVQYFNYTPNNLIFIKFIFTYNLMATYYVGLDQSTIIAIISRVPYKHQKIIYSIIDFPINSPQDMDKLFNKVMSMKAFL